MNSPRSLARLLKQAETDPEILAVILFGSTVRDEAGARSDVDVCLVLQPRAYLAIELSRKKLSYLKHVDLDVQVFQQLPLYIRRRLLREGRVLVARDEEALYELAFRTARAFEHFRPRYQAYLAEIARAGP
jgi:hypothetical protein